MTKWRKLWARKPGFNEKYRGMSAKECLGVARNAITMLCLRR